MMKFSVVIPAYNEAESLPLLYHSLKNVMDGLKEPYEIILINDGSTDKSLEALKNIQGPANVVILDLKRHYGKSPALQAGFDTAQGEVIITMDGDLQNDPEDIPRLLNMFNAGYDVACGWRYDRKDPQNKILASRIANRIRRAITGEKIHDVGCPLRAFKRSVINNVRLSGGLHRFFTLIMLRLGYKIGEVKITHHPRKFGHTKYSMWNRLPEGIFDLARLSFCDIHKLMNNKASYEIKQIIRK